MMSVAPLHVAAIAFMLSSEHVKRIKFNGGRLQILIVPQFRRSEDKGGMAEWSKAEDLSIFLNLLFSRESVGSNPTSVNDGFLFLNLLFFFFCPRRRLLCVENRL
jgi:hypothetical protein